jgi:exodeoxyribonuclease III
MRIATWNVNSLKVRLPQVLDWLAAHRPDVLALQETKLPDDQVPTEALAEAGYRCEHSGQRTYNGVALITRSPVEEPVRDIPDFADPQRRVLAATVGGVRVVNLYVVNGEAVGSEKFAYKLRFLAAVREWLRGQLERHPRLVVVGDFNIAPEDRDVHDPELWRERVLCSTPERAAYAALLELGLADTFRLFEQPAESYSWWDYRAGGFRRNRGLRIDLVLASRALVPACRRCSIDVEPRRSERPSDHAPVVTDFDCGDP